MQQEMHCCCVATGVGPSLQWFSNWVRGPLGDCKAVLRRPFTFPDYSPTILQPVRKSATPSFLARAARLRTKVKFTRCSPDVACVFTAVVHNLFRPGATL